MFGKDIKNEPWRVSARLGVYVIAAIMAAMTAMTAEGGNGQEPVEMRISALKTFIDDGNFVLFHNELMDSQRDADDPTIDTTELARFIVDIWDKNKSAIPDLNWQNATKDEFRIPIAGIITLGIRGRWIDYDQDKINQFLRGKVRADHPFVSTGAISHLGIGGDDKDALLFKELSLTETGQVSRSAIRALGSLCSPAGKQTLIELESEISDAEGRALVAKIFKRYYSDERVMHCYR